MLEITQSNLDVKKTRQPHRSLFEVCNFPGKSKLHIYDGPFKPRRATSHHVQNRYNNSTILRDAQFRRSPTYHHSVDPDDLRVDIDDEDEEGVEDEPDDDDNEGDDDSESESQSSENLISTAIQPPPNHTAPSHKSVWRWFDGLPDTLFPRHHPDVGVGDGEIALDTAELMKLDPWERTFRVSFYNDVEDGEIVLDPAELMQLDRERKFQVWMSSS